MEGLLVRLLCMLLTCTAAFSGYIQKDVAYIPEDATYMQKDIAYIQEDGSTIVEAAEPEQNPINLKKFTFASTRKGGSMEVCADEKLIGATATLIYNSTDPKIQHNAEGTITKECATFNTPEGFELPEDMINYVLTILDDTTGNRQVGKASFAVKDNDYNAKNVKFVSCGDRMYTRRETEVKDIDCNSPSVLVDEKICYTYVVNGTAGFPDSAGCLNLTDESQEVYAEIQVCLPSSAPTNIEENTKYNVKVNSLTYNGDDTDTNLDLSYEDSKVDFTDTTEIIIQNTAEEFTVAVCGSDNANCKPEGFSRGSTEYEVCAVVSKGINSGASEDPGLITDINVVKYVDGGINVLEFGFDNNNAEKYYYYATVVADSNVSVGIDCFNIAQGSTCYGFLNLDGVKGDKEFIVEYSDVGAGPSQAPNTIIQAIK